LIQGLRTGEADADADGRITLDELYDYVYEQMVHATPRQTPGKWSYKQQGDLIIANNPRAAVRPAALPPELQSAMESPFSAVREGAVHELDRPLRGSNASLALAARAALEYLKEDDSRRVSVAAAKSLAAYAEPQHPRVEQVEPKVKVIEDTSGSNHRRGRQCPRLQSASGREMGRINLAIPTGPPSYTLHSLVQVSLRSWGYSSVESFPEAWALV
jgi:hypothetical protein